MLCAYIIGYEAAGHLIKGCDNIQGLTGFHSTGVFGAIAATAVAARLMGLDQQQTNMAFGLVASMGSGLLHNFGTYTKPLHAGMACRSGVMAADLAKKGWLATPAFIENRTGWAHAYVGEGKYDPDKMTANLGRIWMTRDSIIIKKYPSCGSNHGALDALLSLLNEHDIHHEEVARVDVGKFPSIAHVLLHPDPAYAYQGKFSIHYNVATALVDRKINIESFSEASHQRPEYQSAREKVHINVMSNWEPDYSHSAIYNPVTITMKDGRRFSGQVSKRTMHGTPADPLSEQELKDKFRYCGRRRLPEKQVEEALSAWWNLDRASGLTELLDCVTPK